MGMNPNWTLARTSSPNGQAVTLDEAKSHLRVSGNDQDSYLELLIEASTEKLERDINRGIIATTWRQSMYAFPAKGEPIELMMGMNTGVSSIQYIDTDGNLQELSSSLWAYSQGRGVVFNANPDHLWPLTDIKTIGDKVFISFSCGVSEENCVPRLMKKAILLEVARAYFDPAQDNPSNTDNGRSYEMLVRKLIRSSYP
jgi:uncharacterized phiE125 gp8 family phage protein